MKSIYIDVKDFDTEKKKRVQDAFFKMGIKWFASGNLYNNLEKGMYTNTMDNGEVVDRLLFVFDESRSMFLEKLTTYNELMEMAGMYEYIEKEVEVETSPPKMKVSYEKVEEEIFDLKDDLEQEKLYQKVQYQRDYGLIKTTETLAQMLNQGCCYRKVEKKVEWWDDIPEGGVLCWLSDHYEGNRDKLDTVIRTCRDQEYRFVARHGFKHKYATPLTKEEVMKFYTNAEKIEKYL